MMKLVLDNLYHVVIIKCYFVRVVVIPFLVRVHAKQNTTPISWKFKYLTMLMPGCLISWSWSEGKRRKVRGSEAPFQREVIHVCAKVLHV